MEYWETFGVKPHRVLGFGSHGVVYHATVDPKSQKTIASAGRDLVIKSFYEEARFKKEHSNLQVMISRQITPGSFVFPKVIAASGDNKSLLLFPLGHHFACTKETILDGMSNDLAGISPFNGKMLASSQHFCILISALRSVHGPRSADSTGLVHRDIKLNNFFPVFDNSKKVASKILLNDFGSATVKDKPCLFEGALENAPTEILTAFGNGEKYVPKCWHDLAMVVRCIFQRLSPAVYDTMLCQSHKLREQRQKKQRALSIDTFWKVHLRRQPYRDMIEAAESLDYDKLIHLVTELQLGGVAMAL